jgi:hypothetical protein
MSQKRKLEPETGQGTNDGKEDGEADEPPKSRIERIESIAASDLAQEHVAVHGDGQRSQQAAPQDSGDERAPGQSTNRQPLRRS